MDHVDWFRGRGGAIRGRSFKYVLNLPRNGCPQTQIRRLKHSPVGTHFSLKYSYIDAVTSSGEKIRAHPVSDSGTHIDYCFGQFPKALTAIVYQLILARGVHNESRPRFKLLSLYCDRLQPAGYRMVDRKPKTDHGVLGNQQADCPILLKRSLR
jgi:hypothetical protein